jgi:hypothetical protein
VTQANLANDSNPDELAGVQTGWLQLDPLTSAGLLGVFVQSAVIGGAESFTAGRELQYEGGRTVSLPRFN